MESALHRTSGRGTCLQHSRSNDDEVTVVTRTWSSERHFQTGVSCTGQLGGRSSVEKRYASRPAQWMRPSQWGERLYGPHRATPRHNKHARPTNAHFSATGSSGIFSIPRRNSECSLSHVHRHSRRLPHREVAPMCMRSSQSFITPHLTGLGATVCSPRARLISQPGTTLFFRVHQWTTDHSWHSRAMHSARVSPSIVMVDIKQTWASRHNQHAAREI